MNILYVNSLEANNKELARQLASANVLIAEQNKLAKERQEWALHTNEVIGKLNQQLADMTKERDKAKAMPMKYRRMEFNAQLQNENESLRQQLAAALAAIKSKDAALQSAISAHKYESGDLHDALAIQPDDAAIKEGLDQAWCRYPDQ